MKEMTDEQLAKLVQEGDGDSFGELITRFEQKLRRYARRFLNTEDEIDDLVQEVFIKAYTNIQSFNNTMRFSPWIYRIAHNTYVNELKRKERHAITLPDIDLIFAQIPAEESADGEALQSELTKELRQFIGELPVKYREVIILHYFEDLSYKEISDVLKISTSAVGVRITRGRAKLKTLYEQRENK